MSSRRRKTNKQKNDKPVTPAINLEQQQEQPVTETEAVSPAETDNTAEVSVQQTVENSIVKKTGKHGRPLKTDPYGNPVRVKKKGAPLRSTEPVRTVTPADIQKPQVSFMNAIANVEPESLQQRGKGAASTAQAYDHAVMTQTQEDEDSGYSPMIRRMSDSTRAKELRHRRSSGSAYEKDSPVQTTQTLPGAKLRSKRGDPQENQEILERIPEQLKAHPLDEPEQIEYIEQAETTHINLSEGTPGSISDIDVRYQDERREQFKRPKEAKKIRQNEDHENIAGDLQELRTNLSIRIAFLAVLTTISALLTILDWMPNIKLPAFLSSTESPVSFLVIQVLLGAASLPFCGSLLKTGYMKLLQLRADCDSLAAMSMMSAELAAFLLIPSPNMLRGGVASCYVSIGLFSVLMNAIGKKLIATRALRNFERLTDGTPKYGIHYVEDEKRAENLTRGTTGDFPILATMQPVENPEDFLKYTFSTDIADKFCRAAVPIVMFLSLLFAIFMSIVRAESVESVACYGTSIFALCFSACACTAITMISNLPMAMGTKDYVRNSGLLLGYQSVDDFFDVNTVMVDASTLFPRGTTKLESIQVVGESRIQEALQYSASLTQHSGSILKDLFSAAILTEDKMILSVENYEYEDGRGISGWIQNKRVLLGTREMMVQHSVEGLPVSAKEEELVKGGNEALYLSVSGTVSAMYIIKLEASGTVRHWLRELDAEGLFLLVRNHDALLSQRKIAKMFGCPEEMLKMIPGRLEEDYVAETKPLKNASPSMLCAGRLPGFVQTITGARRIRSTATLGLIMQAVTACLGLLYAFIFILLGAYHDISGGILLMYHFICTLITILSVRMKDT